jgi:2-oxoglutarate ferredoxin oxidoreductase subunit beta
MSQIEKQRVWVSGTPRLWRYNPIGARQCAGCHSPIVERIICEVIEEMGIEGNVICVTGIGCSALANFLFDFDSLKVAHGRPVDAATGVKRALRGRPVVFTLQGDGDCIGLGGGALISAASRAEKITVIMANNAVYGQTRGQMAPTTLVGQVTTTTPFGRSPAEHGYPIHTAELVAQIKGTAYSVRTAVNNPANYQRTKKYLKTAFQKQIDNVGFTFVEILEACPTLWRMSPVESLKWLEEVLMAEFPLGEFKNVDKIE